MTTETKKRLTLATSIADQVQDYVLAAYLGGSMAYGQEHSVDHQSDIDMVLVLEKKNIRKLAECPHFANTISEDIITDFLDSQFDFFWNTQIIDEVEVNIFIYDHIAFEQFCTLQGDLKGFTKHTRAGEFPVYCFEGRKDSIHRDIQAHRHGFIYPRPCFVDGKYYCVPPRSDFIRGYHILYEQDNYISHLYDEVLRAIFAQLHRELGPQADYLAVLQSEYIYQNARERYPKEYLDTMEESLKQFFRKKVRRE